MRQAGRFVHRSAKPFTAVVAPFAGGRPKKWRHRSGRDFNSCSIAHLTSAIRSAGASNRPGSNASGGTSSFAFWPTFESQAFKDDSNPCHRAGFGKLDRCRSSSSRLARCRNAAGHSWPLANPQRLRPRIAAGQFSVRQRQTGPKHRSTTPACKSGRTAGRHGGRIRRSRRIPATDA